MTVKNKALLCGWISMAAKVFRGEKNLHGIKRVHDAVFKLIQFYHGNVSD